jgi:NitT/TauT family transport system substrate-binding protein
MRARKFIFLATLLVAVLQVGEGFAVDRLKLAIGQRGLWDSSFAEIGQQVGIFKKHGLELEAFYTSGGGETQQAIISGSADIGVSPGTLGVLGAYGRGAPIRIIAAEATGTAEYYFVRAESPLKKFQDATPETTLAYSTSGSGTHITALRFMKDYGFQAKLVATGNVPATFTSVMSGQVDIGFSTPPFGLEAQEQGKIRILALANDLPSVRNQTVRVTIANAADLARRREVYARFIQAYREVIDWMYSDPRAIEMFAKYAGISPAMAQTVRDRFYPKSMLQLDEIKGIGELMEDAITFKYLARPLNAQQLHELLQLPSKSR